LRASSASTVRQPAFALCLRAVWKRTSHQWPPSCARIVLCVGYPTLKVFRNGQASEYNGPREADGIVAYMRKQVGPAAKPVENAAELEAWINKKKDKVCV
jgi:hypothetical protein